MKEKVWSTQVHKGVNRYLLACWGISRMEAQACGWTRTPEAKLQHQAHGTASWSTLHLFAFSSHFLTKSQTRFSTLLHEVLLLDFKITEWWSPHFSLLNVHSGDRRAGLAVQSTRSSGRGLPSIHVVAHSYPNSRFRGPNALFCLQQVPGTYTVHIHTCTPNIHTLTILRLSFALKREAVSYHMHSHHPPQSPNPETDRESGNQRGKGQTLLNPSFPISTEAVSHSETMIRTEESQSHQPWNHRLANTF